MGRKVTLYELRPYITVVRQLIRTMKNREAIDQALRDLQRSLAEACEADLAARLGSTLRGPTWMLKALYEVHRVTTDLDPLTASEVIAGCYLLRAREPHRFPSDRAFTFSLVSRWRRLARVAFGSYYSQARGRPVLVYRDLPEKTVEVIGEMLSLRYVPFVSRILACSARKLDERQQLRNTLDAGFAS